MDSSLPPLNSVKAFLAKRLLAKASVKVALIAALIPSISAATKELPSADAGQAATSGIPEPTTALLVGIFGLCLILLRQGRN